MFVSNFIAIHPAGSEIFQSEPKWKCEMHWSMQGLLQQHIHFLYAESKRYCMFTFLARSWACWELALESESVSTLPFVIFMHTYTCLGQITHYGCNILLSYLHDSLGCVWDIYLLFLKLKNMAAVVETFLRFVSLETVSVCFSQPSVNFQI